ncbi:MAG: glycosyltransferase family 4 protein [Planctomycetales bacterium]|nr:glycosyltransferase family 4 protein [Planctomycetales bacterium]
MTADQPAPRIAYLTAGAAGMICGSCLRDNALVVALTRMGVDAVLVPTYTPIRTDEADVSIDQVFYGGVNVYLQQRVPLFRYVPAFIDRWLDLPWLIRRVAENGATPDPRILGALTVSMLRGSQGNQRKEVDRLTRWLSETLQPDLVNFSNVLIAGSAAAIKSRLGVPIIVTLQGDDVFLDTLPQRDRDRAIGAIQELAEHVDAFVVFNRFYAEYMQDYLKLPKDRFHLIPLGINVHDFRNVPGIIQRPENSTPTIGYLARLAPEKGLHHLVDAYIEMRRRTDAPAAKLLLAGWMGNQNRAYAEEQFQRLRDAGFADDFEYRGEVDRAGKVQFFSEIDLFSVPTIYQDAKGLYVLESLASGVPVVLPAHGSFPELIESTQGGLLCTPHDAGHLADAIQGLLLDADRRQQLATAGRAAVTVRHSAERMAEDTLTLYRRLLE